MSAGFETAGLLPRFVTPSDVRDLKNRTDPFVRALDVAVASCAGLPDDVRIGWQAFSKAWRSYYDEEDSWLHTAAQMDQGEKYEEDLAHWQERLAGLHCGQNVPGVTPLDGGGDDKSSSKWQGTIKIIAIAGAVVAAAIAIHSVAR
jgi:hypothetical protein